MLVPKGLRSQKVLVQKICQKRILSKLGPKSLVKIGSVTAEILLIWTNVTKTNVTWTNVKVTVGNC